MGREAYHGALQDAIGGRIRILMVLVECFKNERFCGQLKRMKVSLLVGNEAHCISEWGHSFRPDYLKTSICQKEFNISQVLLMVTATLKEVEDMYEKFAVAQYLVSRGVAARAYHTGMQIEQREEIQNRFMGGDLNTVVATSPLVWASTSATSAR